jgi:hypothetical protein
MGLDGGIMHATETYYQKKIEDLQTKVGKVREVIRKWNSVGMQNIPTNFLLEALGEEQHDVQR